jgi:glycosyl transferase family 25
MIKNITILVLIIGSYFYTANLNRQIKAKNYKLDEAVQTLKLYRIESFKDIKKNDNLKDGKIFVMNLDQHKERWQKVSKQLDDAKLKYTRFNAILGHNAVIVNQNGDRYVGLDLKNGKLKFEYNKTYQIHCRNADWIYYVSDPKHSLSAGEIGIYCSHYEIINEIANKNLRYGLIFEDDIVLAKGFKEYLTKVINNINNPDIELLYLAIGLNVNKKWYSFSEIQDDIKNYHHFMGLPQDIKDINFVKINDHISKYIGSKNANRINGHGAGYAYIITNYGAKKLQQMMKISSHTSDAILSEYRKNDEINIYVANKVMVGVNLESSYGGQKNNII